MPMQVPIAAGNKALRVDSKKYGVNDCPLRNASRPERAPSSPLLRTFWPYLTSDWDHLLKFIHLPSFAVIKRWRIDFNTVGTGRQYTGSRFGVTRITHGCANKRQLWPGMAQDARSRWLIAESEGLDLNNYVVIRMQRERRASAMPRETPELQPEAVTSDG